MATHPKATDPKPIDHFCAFVKEQTKRHIGRDISDNEYGYVPRSALLSYWTKAKINEVMRAYEPRLSFKVTTIKQSYIQAFSALVYANAAQNYKSFTGYSLTDSRLPLSQFPAEWPNSKSFQELWKTFNQVQWIFFPLSLDSDQLENRLLSSQMILPIDKAELVNHGDAASVQRIVTNHTCNNLVPKSADTILPSQNTFILKTYYNDKFERLYDNEVKALTTLQNVPSPHIITYYGSFRQNGTFNLILEHADRGSLSNFLESKPPPSTDEDILRFWKSLFQILHGLDRIHQASTPDDNNIRGIHEDIKPDNILLSSTCSSSLYEFTPKVADFGLFSHVRESKTNSSEAMGLDMYGNPRYSSPECSVNSVEARNGINWITQKADIFSLGAVLSDCAAWVAGGKDFRIQYYSRRLDYHSKIRTFRKSGYEGCFHDGITRLPIVDEVHCEIRDKCGLHDRITPHVVNLVEHNMLLPKSDDRFNARPLFLKWDRILQSFEPSLSPSSPTSPLLESPPPQSPPLQSPCFPSPTSGSETNKDFQTPVLHVEVPSSSSSDVDAAGSHIEKSEQSSLRLSTDPGTSITPDQRTIASTSPAVDQRTIPREQGNKCNIDDLFQYREDSKDRHKVVKSDVDKQVKDILHNLEDRDQFFFIDDSTSMKPHRDRVNTAFMALSYVAKRLDPNKLELCFSSKPEDVKCTRRTSKLAKIIFTRKYKAIPTLMEKNFGLLVKNIIKRLPYRILGFNINPLARKPLSIYIFTDGNWGISAKACGVENPLQRLMNEIKERHLPRDQVSLHFVRFGELDDGKRHLEFLDKFGEDDGWDMVDVKHIDNPVQSIFLGPIDPGNDRLDYNT